MPTIAYQDLFDRIDEAEVVRVCRELVRFQTVNPPGEEQVAAEYVARLLGRAGFESGLVPLAAGRASTLGHLRGSGERPGLLFSGHLDVVPVGAQGWTYPPFEAEMADANAPACSSAGTLTWCRWEHRAGLTRRSRRRWRTTRSGGGARRT